VTERVYTELHVAVALDTAISCVQFLSTIMAVTPPSLQLPEDVTPSLMEHSLIELRVLRRLALREHARRKVA
jgi:hypothetical protein